jgi:hypothetical protein
VIERIFGVIKRRFRILLIAPEYSLAVQARIPAALCTLHNFIRHHDPEEGALPKLSDAGHHNAYQDATADQGEVEGEVEEGGGNARRDEIAQAMWDDYQRILAERLANGDDGDDEDEEGEEEEEEEEEEEDVEG